MFHAFVLMFLFSLLLRQMISCFNVGLEKILGDHQPFIETSIPDSYDEEVAQESKFQNLLNELNRSRDDLISDDDLSIIVNRVGSDMYLKIKNMPTVSKKTEEELQRELRHIKGLLGVSTIPCCNDLQLYFVCLN